MTKFSDRWKIAELRECFSAKRKLASETLLDMLLAANIRNKVRAGNILNYGRHNQINKNHAREGTHLD